MVNVSPQFEFDLVHRSLLPSYMVITLCIAFQEKLSRYLIQTSTSYMWDRSVVIDKLVESVVLKNPTCQYIIGSDAKYVLLLVHWLPRSFISYLVKKDSGIDDIILGSFKN